MEEKTMYILIGFWIGCMIIFWTHVATCPCSTLNPKIDEMKEKIKEYEKSHSSVSRDSIFLTNFLGYGYPDKMVGWRDSE